MNLFAAIPVEEASQVSQARRVATTWATRLGFSETRTGQAALIATELATNLSKHARRGEILFSLVDDGSGAGPDGIEIIALDQGPGIPDVALSRRDGFSTSGTLGHGLGAIERQADGFDLFSMPTGTAIMAQLCRDTPRPRPRKGPIQLASVLVSKPGEDTVGDGWSWRVRDERLAIILADGLGHGLFAHEASQRAVDLFGGVHEESPQRIIQDVHSALRATRGAAVATLVADLQRGVVRYCGIGNVAAHILNSRSTRQSLVSQNGTAGHRAARIQEFSYPLDPGWLLVMHTDGISSSWDLSAYPGLRGRHPSLIAGIIYRDFSRRRDDVGIVVARARQLNTPSGP
jgi:anti-sigma regulatory factor (Ser/Thr protein kinase)